MENPLFNNKDVLDSVIDSSFFNDYKINFKFKGSTVH